MTSINKKQHGFTTIEIVLIIVIVAIVGFVGWFVYHTKQNSDNALNQASSTSQNAGPHFAKPNQSKAKPSTNTKTQ